MTDPEPPGPDHWASSGKFARVPRDVPITAGDLPGRRPGDRLARPLRRLRSRSRTASTSIIDLEEMPDLNRVGDLALYVSSRATERGGGLTGSGKPAPRGDGSRSGKRRHDGSSRGPNGP